MRLAPMAQSSTPPLQRFNTIRLAVLVLGSVTSCATLTLTPQAGALAAAGGLEVEVEDGRLTAALGSVPIADVLAAVADQTGAKLSVRGELGNARPQAFSGVPLGEALPRLVQPNGVILQFDTGAGTARRLLAIHAVAPGTPGKATGPSAYRIDPRPGAQPRLWDYEDSEKLPEPEQRVALLRKLAKQRQPPLHTFTFVLAGDPDPAVRRITLGLVAGLPGEEARRTLVEAVADSDPEMRIDALRALASSRDKPVNLLAQVAKSDAEATVRIAAIAMLERRDGELVRAVLEGARNDPDPHVREAVEQALRR